MVVDLATARERSVRREGRATSQYALQIDKEKAIHLSSLCDVTDARSRATPEKAKSVRKTALPR
jgi:hypothetical protein